MKARQFEAPLERTPGVTWTPSAVSGLVGQRPMMDGRRCEVTAARLDDRGRVYVTIKVSD